MNRLIVPWTHGGLTYSSNYNNSVKHLRQVHDYLHERNIRIFNYINSKHILVKILTLLEYESNNSIFDIHSFVIDKLPYITTTLELNTSFNIGGIHVNTFYTKHCVITSNYDNVIDDTLGWEEIMAVTCLTHPLTDIDVLLPKTGGELPEGLSVINIDIPKLAIQYHLWKADNNDSNVSTFLTSYVLNNMMKQSITIGLRNRLIGNGTVEDKDPIAKSYNEIITNLNNKSILLTKVMCIVPFPWGNYYDNVPKIDTFTTPFNYWVSIVVYTEWLYPIFKLLPKTNVVKSSNNLITRYVKTNNVDRFIPKTYKEEVSAKFNYIMNSKR